MIVIIALFYVSLATMVAMVSWKLFSLRELKLSLIEGMEKELHGNLYEVLHQAYHSFLTKVIFRARTMLVAVFYTVAHEVLRVTGVAGQKLKARHGKWFDMVKGKGVVHKKGSVSFFLRDIAEHKKTLQER